MNLSKEKKVLIQAAKSAGKVLLKYYGNNEKIKEKSNKSLVSKADLEANRAIIGIIKKNFPGHSILSEETGFENKKSDYKWVLDPLDGTHNFLHEISIFGTSIALEYKNEVVLGVLNFPVLKILAYAEKGKGTFVNGKKAGVSDKGKLDYSFISVDYGQYDRKQRLKMMENFGSKNIDFRSFGAAVYELLLVACGNSDAYIISSTNEWDVAAGILLIEESGGKITDLHGLGWNFAKKNFLMSNGKLHNTILKYTKK